MDARSPNRPTSRSRRESGLVQRVRTSLTRGFTAKRAPLVLIACSGGQDSVALANVLASLVRTGTIHAEIVHVDHGVRFDSTDAAEGVRRIGTDLEMPVYMERLDARAIRDHDGVGDEEALRRERYLAIGQVAQRREADFVALAHHQRDQAETVLLHLMRGTGLHGATGMREWSRMEVPWWPSRLSSRPLTLWRPFLSEEWEDIAEVARTSGFPIFEDSTNLDRRIRRNAVRHDVLPVLESIAPGSTSNIARFAELAGEDDDELDRIALSRLRTEQGGGLLRSWLVGVSRSIQRRIIRRWILSTPYDGELTLNRINAVCLMAARNRTGSLVEIGAGWSVVLTQGLLTLHPPEDGTIEG